MAYTSTVVKIGMLVETGVVPDADLPAETRRRPDGDSAVLPHHII